MAMRGKDAFHSYSARILVMSPPSASAKKTELNFPIASPEPSKASV